MHVQYPQPSACTDGNCSQQQSRSGDQTSKMQPQCLEGEWLRDEKEGRFHHNHFVVFISRHLNIYFLKNFTMIECPGLIFGPSRKDEHIAPETVPVSCSTAGDVP